MKKVMIAVLSLAVLFGFAACEDGSSSTTSDMIAGATVTGGEKVYIPGETLDLSDYTFSLTMADGSTQPASASDFVFDSLIVKKPQDGDTTTFTASYKGMSNVGVTVVAKVGTVTDLKISGEPTVDTYYATSDAKYKKIDLSGLTIEATYEYRGTTGTREVAYDNENLKPSMTWTAGPQDVTVAFDQSASDEYSVTVVANLVSSIDLKATEGYTIYAGSTAKKLSYTTTPSTTAGVYVEATYQNGETKVLSNSDATITFGTASDTITTAFASIGDLTPAKVEATTLYAHCEGLNAVAGFEKTVDLPLNVAENAETKLSVTAGTGFKVGTDYRDLADSEFQKLIVVDVLRADGSKAATNLPAAEYTIVSPTKENRDLSKMSAGERLLVSVSATRNGKTLTGEAELVLLANS